LIESIDERGSGLVNTMQKVAVCLCQPMALVLPVNFLMML